MIVGGSAGPGYEPVARAFERVLDGAAAGGAFAAVVDGEVVVDLWGGAADAAAGRAWERDTAAVVFSGAKGVCATATLLLADRGLVDLERPVADYWPEFAAHGKGGVRVRHALSHTAGVPGISARADLGTLLDPGAAAALVAAERPWSAPGEHVVYHALTYGWICAELVRRVDGRPLGRFVAEEIAAPLGLELWLGVAPGLERRVARLVPAAGYKVASPAEAPDPRLALVYAGLLGAEPFLWNDPAVLAAEVPAAGGVATARALARLYGCLARGGELDGVRLLSSEAVDLGRRELSRGVCEVSGWPYAFGAGFELQAGRSALGPPPDAFGHTGSGGSSHGAWPSLRTGFSWVTADLRGWEHDRRAATLLEALYEAVTA